MRKQIRYINGGLWLVLMVPLALLSWRELSWPADSGRAWINGRNARQIEALYDEKFVMKDWATNAWAAFDYLVFNEGRAGAVVGKQGWLFSKEEFVWSAAEAAHLQASLDEIASVAQQFSKAHIQLLPVLLPAKSEIYSNQLGQENAQLQARLYEQALNGLASRGVRITDLRPLLWRAAKQQDVFLKTDTHWTPFGASQVALWAAQQLGGQGDSQRFSTKPGEAKLYRGDLLNYIPLAPHFEDWGPEADLLVTPVTLDNGGGDDLLAETPAISRLLVGTSYSANESWNFAGAIKQASGQDLVNYAEDGKGPFLPMRTWLADNPLASTDIRQVIWEIPVRYLVQPLPTPAS
jgi:alginate O-acetyltransferase complex protein AlgJ